MLNGVIPWNPIFHGILCLPHQFHGMKRVIDLTASDSPPAKKRSAVQPSSSSREEGSFRLVSYNLDGLAEENLEERTHAALALILSEQADVIFLQEVVPRTALLILPILSGSGYESSDSLAALDSLGGYFTLSFVRKAAFPQGKVLFRRVDYEGDGRSHQGRTLLLTTIALASRHTESQKQEMPALLCINLHLESCGKAFQSEESRIRQSQLGTALRYLHEHPGPALAGGDLNLRDAEAKAVLNRHHRQLFYSPVVDAFEVVESARQVGGSTWFLPGNPKVSCRFDRLYNNDKEGLRPISYQLIGEEEVVEEGPYRTPSDHRGVVIDYRLSPLSLSSSDARTGAGVATVPLAEAQKGEEREAQKKVSRRELLAAAAVKRMAQAKEEQERDQKV